MSEALDFEVARARLLALPTPLFAERVSLGLAEGRVLAAPVLSEADRPAFDNSAMDGYALATPDLLLEPPFVMQIVGEVRAGSEPKPLQTGCAARIFTGAPLPLGADAVLLQENTERTGDRIRFTHRPYVGEHVRARGSDLKAGTIAVPAGVRLNAFSLSLCTSLEQREVTVFARPRVTLLCTGDELRAPGSVNLGPGSIVESNSVALCSLLTQAGADVKLGAYVPDSLEATELALRAALEVSDLVITVGGASVGDHDYVKPALKNLGAEVDFWKVKIKPGKPLLVAHFLATKTHSEANLAPEKGSALEPRNVLVLGLPGNPVSAQLTCLLFALPLVRKLQGQSVTEAPFRLVPLLGKLSQKPGRAGLFRATWQPNGVLPLPDSSSGSVLSMSQADAIILAAAHQSEFEAGSLVPTMSLYEAIYL